MNASRRLFGKTLSTGLGALGVAGLSACMSPPRKAPERIQDASRIADLCGRPFWNQRVVAFAPRAKGSAV